jgi:uncharacterized protein YbaR (Trm112 family)
MFRCPECRSTLYLNVGNEGFIEIKAILNIEGRSIGVSSLDLTLNKNIMINLAEELTCAGCGKHFEIKDSWAMCGECGKLFPLKDLKLIEGVKSCCEGCLDYYTRRDYNVEPLLDALENLK